MTQRRIQADIRWQPFEITYQLFVDGHKVADGKRCDKDLTQQMSFRIPRASKAIRLFGWAGLLLKMAKSAKVVKTALATGSLAIYSWLFSPFFALVLVASLMFHELGRRYARYYFDIESKGLYLVPFFGGFALGEERIDTRWQGMVIALAGPSVGLVMSLFYLFVYGLTGNLMFASLSSFNALLNLFMLMPVLPLAGGHVLKHLSFSFKSRPAAATCFGVVGAGVVSTFYLGWYLFTALLVAGGTEILIAWRQRRLSCLVPLDGYGQAFSLAWYGTLLLCLYGVVWFFAGMGNDVLGLPLRLLQI